VKALKTFKVILALIVSALVLDAACFQNLSNYSAIEVQMEEPVDEDVTDDTEDDKEHTPFEIQIKSHYPDFAHYTNYLLNHTHQVQETFSPPPERHQVL
jgi:hypothetical protein